MKNLQGPIVIAILFTAFVIMAFTFDGEGDHYSIKSSSGAPAGYSGDPAGGTKNCTNCHSGDAQQQAGWITSNIPVTGYVPGTTYTITSTATGNGITKFGFQVSPQNSGGTILGTLVNTGDETKLVSGTNYVTHTTAGNSGSDTKIWTFDWVAPDAGAGEVTFYGAFNLANNNGDTSGDEIKLSTLTVTEDESSAIFTHDSNNSLNIYPNPANAYIVIETAAEMEVSGYHIYDQSGREVQAGQLTYRSTTVDIEQLKAGIYFFKVSGDTEQSAKFIKE